ncbi:hypothetical protein FOZ62_025265, partial [Perkinsus olseni]
MNCGSSISLRSFARLGGVVSLRDTAHRLEFIRTDRRLKRDITPLSVALEPTGEESVPDREGPASQLLRELRPVAFELESEVQAEAERRRFGFIAQDLERLLPEVVHRSEGQDTLSVLYQDLIAILTGAVQEQQSRIRELEERLTDLQARFEAHLLEHLLYTNGTVNVTSQSA